MKSTYWLWRFADSAVTHLQYGFSRCRTVPAALFFVCVSLFASSSRALELIDIRPTVVHASLFPASAADQLAQLPAFDSSGLVSISGNTASGTLIHQNWVLTAAHVISSNPGRHDLSSASFFVGGQFYSATFAEVHPNWNGNVGSGFDIALIRLETSLRSISPARYDLAPADLAGQEITFLGYGLGGSGETGAVAGTGGTKRAGTNRLDVDGSLLGLNSSIYLADFDSGSANHNYLGSSIPASFESIPAPGDSGGGVFMSVNGQSILVGVNSFVASFIGPTNSAYGNVAGFQSIHPHLAWIQSIAHAPEPASLILGILCVIAGWWIVEHKSKKEESRPSVRR